MLSRYALRGDQRERIEGLLPDGPAGLAPRRATTGSLLMRRCIATGQAFFEEICRRALVTSESCTCATHGGASQACGSVCSRP